MTDKELQVILQEGEGYRIEFKESVNSSLDKELVAFANSSGGRVFVGIRDDRTVKGINVDNRLKTQVQDIANNCDPPIPVLFEEYKNILVVYVREGDDRPYKCSTGFYVRVGPISQKLDRDEIAALMRSEGKVRFDELECKKFNPKRHFSSEKLGRFLQLAGISRTMDSPAMLVNLDAAEKQAGRLVVNNTGALFFSKNLDDIYRHVCVTCALYKGTEKVDVLDRKDFNNDILSSIDDAMVFLKQHLSVRYEMTGTPRRQEIPELPYDALREALVNAVAHRDYFERGASVMVEMFDDRIEISNPGGLVKALRPEEFGKKSVLRNPNIASLLHRVKYIEKMGTGISKMRALLKAAKLRPPEFEFDSFFTVTFRRLTKRTGFVHAVSDPIVAAIHEAIRVGVLEGVDEGISEGGREHISEGTIGKLSLALSYMQRAGSITTSDALEIVGGSVRTVRRIFSLLKNLNLVVFEGAPKTGKFVLTTRARALLKAQGLSG